MKLVVILRDHSVVEVNCTSYVYDSCTHELDYYQNYKFLKVKEVYGISCMEEDCNV